MSDEAALTQPLGLDDAAEPAEPPLPLFAAFGIELEYMIVNATSLDVLPVADRVLHAVAGSYAMELERGAVAWSNELALHVIELKTNGPVASLEGLATTFQHSLGELQALLEPLGGRLLPTAMHPWMDPARELALWPHGYNEVYASFDRIFSCQGHGWANLQSMHINLPFANDDEFGRLHAAIRLVLPLLPGLAASSPIVEGRVTGFLDTRLQVYRDNAARVPEVTGCVIPERVFSRADYESQILGRIYRALEPHDAARVLCHEWVNARGCIARFDRMAIEIRLLDVQECPAADIAIARAVVAVVRALVEERFCSYREQQGWDERELAALLEQGVRAGDAAVIGNARYLQALGCSGAGALALRDVWACLVDATLEGGSASSDYRTLDHITSRGCLGRRILEAVGPEPPRQRLYEVYERLAQCLEHGELF